MKNTYLVHRFHPNLRIGFEPSVLRGNRLVPVHCRQGRWDSACGAHAAATAMALLGEIHDVATLSERRNGVAARLWAAARANYFDGVTVHELSTMIHSMGTDKKIKICTARHAECLVFILSQLTRGKVIIASWHSRRGHEHHWTTVVGVEGLQAGASFSPSALLCLDPAVVEPLLCGYNARLEYTSHPASRSSSYILYRCADGTKLAVTLTGAVAVGGGD